MKTNSRFQSYFPILYYLGEFFIILASTEIMLFLTYTSWTYLNYIFIVFWLIVSVISKSYVLGRGIRNSKLVRSTINILFFFSGFVAIINMLFYNIQFHLLTIIMAVAIFYFLILTYRLFINFILGKYRAFGGNILRCIIVGTNSHGLDLFNEILKYPELGYRANGIFSFDKNLNKKNLNVPFLGKLKKIPDDIFKQNNVIFFSDKLSDKAQGFILSKADEYNLKANIIPDLVDHDFNNFFISKIVSVPFININKLPLDSAYNQFLKRTFDVVFSFLILIIFLSWMIPVFGLLIKISSRGPVFFVQSREGHKGTFFRCIKFRTMILNENSDLKWADDNDDRLTRIGKILRLTALDEMPQFINVLFGDMSVVGPRPHPINLNKEYKTKITLFNKRHRFKPGITGLAQSKGFSGFITGLNDMRDRVKMDIFYFKNWSILLDIKIVTMTFIKMISNLNLSSKN
ncbi:exopolysaccharide biosynthesis polyprenyl glycosylphosphotransferase [Flavobacteriaceae bacterium]|nr:exopolysaccharide biosynthesis polyprenyl glycosylphosphotransferase [Flavobacteriaceae bacterium]